MADIDLAAENIGAYLSRQADKSLLRFITCGSVDDGKSTLIGRLLYDSKLLYEDHLAALEADSKRVGTQGGNIDFALLVDGLAAEREQGITIDVAYRFFSTDARKFIVADTPGHEQYTRNMVTGASTADLAILLIDARRGVLEQTRRHAYLASLVGIRHVVLAVNKMDLVGFEEARFRAIVEDFAGFAEGLGLDEVTAIPMSALGGDNIVDPSTNMPWYQGPALLRHLESVEIENDRLRTAPFRMAVQYVSRPNLDFRGYAGIIASGTLAVGEEIRILPSGRRSRVKRLLVGDRDVERVQVGQSVMIVLEGESDCSRGDVIAAAATPPTIADLIDAHIVWMTDEELLPGRPYLMKIGARTVGMSVSEILYQVDVNSAGERPAKTLDLNAIGRVGLRTDQPVVFDPYADNRDMGGFIIIDRLSNATVGAGMIKGALRRAQNVHWQALDVDKRARAAMNGQRPVVLWFTGLSGAGKSTIANLVEKKLHSYGRRTYTLDGDNVRHGLNKDLGFSDADRVENIRRIAEVAKLMVDAGLVVITSFISPFRSERQLARDLLEPGEFVEIHVDTPLADAERRDVKGLYAKARAGEIRNFTGIDSPYEAPEKPEIHIDTTALTAEEAADLIVSELLKDEFGSGL